MKASKNFRFATVALIGAASFVAAACNSNTNPNPNPSPSSTGSGSGGGASANAWVTNHYNNARSGANVQETTLTPANVNPNTFGKITAYPTDGYSYAQPLYVPHVPIAGQGIHNVVYVATENDSVYAYDADSSTANPAPLWHVSFTDAANNITTLTQADTQCTDLGPQEGITGTPVIDTGTNTLYVVAATKKTWPSGQIEYHQQLHALDITTGAERANSPMELVANDFDPLKSLQRSALSEANGKIYIAFASNCDTGPYNGMIMAYNATTLEQESVFYAAQAGNAAGIWTTQTGMALDDAGHIFVTTGNGSFDGQNNFGCSILRVEDGNLGLKLVDGFTPPDQASMNNQVIDLDVGSGGAMLLPDNAGSTAHQHLLVEAGKSGQVYLVDRDHMGGYLPSADPSPSPSNPPSFSNIVQTFNLNGSFYGQNGNNPAPINDGMYGTPAYYNGRIYFAPVRDVIRSYAVTGGAFAADATGAVAPTDATPASFDTATFSSSSESYTTACTLGTPATCTTLTMGWPGGTPTITANGSTNGILWFVNTSHANDGGAAAGFPGNPAILYAFDAMNLAKGPIYASNGAAAGDVPGIAQKHISPTVINGRVYFATRAEIEVYANK